MVVRIAQWSLISGSGVHCCTSDGREVKIKKLSVLGPWVVKSTIWEKPHSVYIFIASSLISRRYLWDVTDPFFQSMSGRLKSP